MLLDFSIKGYGIFKDTVVLDMETVDIANLEDNEANVLWSGGDSYLQCVGVFGKHLLGRDDIIKGIGYARDVIVNDNTSMNCAFSFKIALNGVHYEYEVTIDTGKIVNEKLKELQDGDARILFTRDTNGYIILNLGSIDMRYSRNDVTLLKQLSVLGNDVCSNIFNWFKDKLIFLDLEDTGVHNTSDIDLDKVNNIMCKLNSGMPKVECDNGVLVNVLTDGTRLECNKSMQRFILFWVALESCKAHNDVLVVNNIDVALDVSLLEYVLDLYFDGENSGQLVFTTNNVDVLYRELLVRYDAIYLVDNDMDGKLYSLSDFKGIDDIDIYSSYLLGKLGGVYIKGM